MEIPILKPALAQQQDCRRGGREDAPRRGLGVRDTKDITVEREMSAELQKQKAALEKSLNEHQLKLIDLETKRGTRARARISSSCTSAYKK